MEITRTQLPGAVVTMARDGSSAVVEAPTRPVRIDGHTFGVADIDQAPPHRGEVHPDGDELLYVISGRCEVVLEEGGTEETVGTETRHVLEPGDAMVVPQGHWHRIETLEPYRLVHLTPGPGDGHRPLTRG
jgi:mannose-6-phosphate isomerase-like protein (cupin superfamily)